MSRRVALWVLVFSVLWGASLALVVLATTWVAFDLLAVPGQDLDSVLARLKQMDNALVVLMIAAPLLQPGVATALWSQVRSTLLPSLHPPSVAASSGASAPSPPSTLPPSLLLRVPLPV